MRHRTAYGKESRRKRAWTPFDVSDTALRLMEIDGEVRKSFGWNYNVFDVDENYSPYGDEWDEYVQSVEYELKHPDVGDPIYPEDVTYHDEAVLVDSNHHYLLLALEQLGYVNVKRAAKRVSRKTASTYSRVQVGFEDDYDLDIEFEYDPTSPEWCAWHCNIQALDDRGDEIAHRGFSATGIGETAMEAAREALGQMGVGFIFDDMFMQRVRELADVAHMEQL